MADLRHPERSDGNLVGWEAELAERLVSLRELPVPPSFAPEATRQFLQRLPVQPLKATAPTKRPAPILRLCMRFAVALVACLLPLSGVGYATATSLPGDPLYGLKRQVEIAQLNVTPFEQQPELSETLLDRRLDEVVQLVEQQASEERVDAGVREYSAATVALGHAPATADRKRVFQRHLAVLASLQSGAPKQTRTALEMAQRAAQEQLGKKNPIPQPTAFVPVTRASQTATRAVATPTRSATAVRSKPTVSDPFIEEPRTNAQEPSAVPPTATTETVEAAQPTVAATETEQPTATSSPVAPTATAKPVSPRRTPRPTHAPTASPNAPPVSAEPEEHGDNGHSSAPATPQPANDQHHRDSPSVEATPAPPSERPREEPRRPDGSAPQDNPSERPTEGPHGSDNDNAQDNRSEHPNNQPGRPESESGRDGSHESPSAPNDTSAPNDESEQRPNHSEPSDQPDQPDEREQSPRQEGSHEQPPRRP